MSSTRVKTTYSTEGPYGSTETQELYCKHSHSADSVTFYDSKGDIQGMMFSSWDRGNDLWDAMNRLWFPFKDKWGGELKEGVEYYYTDPWETQIT